MQELSDIQIPEMVPVMTLQETVLFPHAVMPLFIFEQRYRKMLQDVLQSHRLFALFKESELEENRGHEEPPSAVGTIGIVRAAHQNPDGTSNLALQGISRVRLVEIVRESPYRLIRVEQCTDCQADDKEIPSLRQNILQVIDQHQYLTKGLPKDYLQFIKTLESPGPFIDVAAHSICHDPNFKQRLLETLSLQERFDLFLNFLSAECKKHDLFKQLQGKTRDEEIDLN